MKTSTIFKNSFAVFAEEDYIQLDEILKEYNDLIKMVDIQPVTDNGYMGILLFKDDSFGIIIWINKSLEVFAIDNVLELFTVSNDQIVSKNKELIIRYRDSLIRELYEAYQTDDNSNERSGLHIREN